MLCRNAMSAMWPMRMSLPLCWMGGFASNRFTFSWAFPPNHSVALMCPVTFTWLELPLRTSTLPAPVVKSRCTGPVACKVRWNEPSTEAAAGNGRQTRAAIAQAPRMEGVIFRGFMISPERLNAQPGNWFVPWPLLQHHLVAFFQTAEQLCLGPV